MNLRPGPTAAALFLRGFLMSVGVCLFIALCVLAGMALEASSRPATAPAVPSAYRLPAVSPSPTPGAIPAPAGTIPIPGATRGLPTATPTDPCTWTPTGGQLSPTQSAPLLSAYGLTAGQVAGWEPWLPTYLGGSGTDPQNVFPMTSAQDVALKHGLDGTVAKDLCASRPFGQAGGPSGPMAATITLDYWGYWGPEGPVQS
jgi:hypothetical protein